MSVNLHDLANNAPFGRAATVLRKAGLWDDYAGLPEKEYVVTLEVKSVEVVVIKARHEDEAATLAERMASVHDEAEVVEVEERKK